MSETQTPARKIALAPGQSDQMFPVAVHGSSPLSGLFLRAGDEPLAVVPDNSEEDGVSESLADSLVERGFAIYVESEEPVTDAHVTDTSGAPVPAPGPADASVATLAPTAPPSSDAAVEVEAQEEQAHLDGAAESATANHEDVPE